MLIDQIDRIDQLIDWLVDWYLQSFDTFMRYKKLKKNTFKQIL